MNPPEVAELVIRFGLGFVGVGVAIWLGAQIERMRAHRTNLQAIAAAAEATDRVILALISHLADHYGATTRELKDAGFAEDLILAAWHRKAIRPIARLQGIPESRQRWHVVGEVPNHVDALATVGQIAGPQAVRLAHHYDGCLIGMAETTPAVARGETGGAVYVYDIERLLRQIIREQDVGRDAAAAILQQLADRRCDGRPSGVLPMFLANGTTISRLED